MAEKSWNKNVRFNRNSESAMQAWSLLHSDEVEKEFKSPFTAGVPSFFDCGSTFLYGYSYICNSGYIPPHYYCHMLPLLSCTAAIV